MKTIAVLIMLAIFMMPAVAMPPQPWGDNPDVCKVSINTGSVILNVFTYYNNITSQWEAQVGTITATQNILIPFVFKSDQNGLIDIDTSSYS
jgi:hypothetical protein